jgi:hypothetical protein
VANELIEPSKGLTAISIIRDGMGLLTSTLPRAWGVWLVVVLFAPSAILIDHAIGIRSTSRYWEIRSGSLFLELFVGTGWTFVASARAMIGSTSRVWVPDGYFWQSIGAQVAIAAVTYPIMLVTIFLLSERFDSATSYRHPREIIFESLPVLLRFVITIAVMRIALWPIARAIGDRATSFGAVWRGMDGAVWPLIRAYVLLVGPLHAAHLGITVWTLSLSGRSNLQFYVNIANNLFRAVDVILVYSIFNAVYARVFMPVGSPFSNNSVVDVFD